MRLGLPSKAAASVERLGHSRELAVAGTFWLARFGSRQVSFINYQTRYLWDGTGDDWRRRDAMAGARGHVLPRDLGATARLRPGTGVQRPKHLFEIKVAPQIKARDERDGVFALWGNTGGAGVKQAKWQSQFKTANFREARFLFLYTPRIKHNASSRRFCATAAIVPNY